MWFVKPGTLAGLIVCLALTFGAASLAASQVTGISGTLTATYTQQDSVVVGDANGHIMTLGKSEGKNVSKGEHEFMNGARVVNMSYSDLTKGNGAHQGYIEFELGKDAVYAKWEGKVTTVLSPEGAPVTSFAGTFKYIKGSGQFENIKGGGTFKGEFTSKTAYSVEWQGEYLTEKK
jgi:hypothetical protein